MFKIVIPTLPPLGGLFLLSINLGTPLEVRYRLSLAATSPSFVFARLSCAILRSFICLHYCPIQHVPAESTRSAGEVSRLEQVITAYTLARCWPEVSARSAVYRVRLLGRVSF